MDLLTIHLSVIPCVQIPTQLNPLFIRQKGFFTMTLKRSKRLRWIHLIWHQLQGERAVDLLSGGFFHHWFGFSLAFGELQVRG